LIDPKIRPDYSSVILEEGYMPLKLFCTPCNDPEIYAKRLAYEDVIKVYNAITKNDTVKKLLKSHKDTYLVGFEDFTPAECGQF
jgi:hypothetical protein